MSTPAQLVLGTILLRLPDHYRTGGKVREIMLAYRYGYADPLWPKSGAMFAHNVAAMELCAAHGKGGKASRRLIQILAKENLVYGSKLEVSKNSL